MTSGSTSSSWSAATTATRSVPATRSASALGALVPDLFAEIDYGHESLTDQLEEYGVRQFEIDVMADPDGGLYATPSALEILEIAEEPDPELLEPGFKVPPHRRTSTTRRTCETLRRLSLSELQRHGPSANPGSPTR